MNELSCMMYETFKPLGEDFIREGYLKDINVIAVQEEKQEAKSCK